MVLLSPRWSEFITLLNWSLLCSTNPSQSLNNSFRLFVLFFFFLLLLLFSFSVLCAVLCKAVFSLLWLFLLGSVDSSLRLLIIKHNIELWFCFYCNTSKQYLFSLLSLLLRAVYWTESGDLIWIRIQVRYTLILLAHQYIEFFKNWKLSA